MNHEELLKKLSTKVTCACEVDNNWDFEVICAIVELHKPVINALPDETCLACQDLYPCKTIQIIEKELG